MAVLGIATGSVTVAAMSRIGATLAVGLACLAGQALAGGPYVARHPEASLGRVIGTGHCVEYVKKVAGAPLTSRWRPGARVRGNRSIARGTAIATFGVDGRYTSGTGNHAAIYVGQDHSGIWVYDQWRGRPVSKRLIRFEGGKGSKRGNKSNDGTLFRVIK